MDGGKWCFFARYFWLQVTEGVNRSEARQPKPSKLFSVTQTTEQAWFTVCTISVCFLDHISDFRLDTFMSSFFFTWILEYMKLFSLHHVQTRHNTIKWQAIKKKNSSMLRWIVLHNCDKCCNVLSIYLASCPGSATHSTILFALDPTSHNCRLNIKCVLIGAAVLHSAWTDKLLVTVNLLHHVWKGHGVIQLPGVSGTPVFNLLDMF